MARVMIVDDDHVTVSLLETLLELDGFQVSVVRRGMDVIPQAEADNPDVIMVDFHLADMEGTDVVKSLRAHHSLGGIPIVMASGMDVSTEALAAGANKFVVKPFEPSDLPNLFHSLIND